jgi:hypothetical protein
MFPVRPIDRDQVEVEARAKTLWGDSREEVVKFIMMQGISAAEATEIAAGLFAERTATIRNTGLKKILMGIPMTLFPIIAWIFFVAVIHVLFIKIWALTMVVGLYGMYCLLKGLIMFFSPGSEPGDVSDK